MSSALDRLDPVIQHHVVNTLGWSSLRPLQQDAVAPILDGVDALLLAPTAGGKTEAAMLPVLSAMHRESWRGLSVIYVCPIKALLNNVSQRLEAYAAWTGRRVAVWHGDVTAPQRSRLLREPPDILLTTPESLESMLISLRVEHATFFAGLRVVIVDELHAFAGDDRGWHLLAVLERLTRVAGRPLQRLGLTATVGNPQELLAWLQGSGAGRRPGVVVAPPADGAPLDPDVEVDFVGSVANAATVIATLHRGEKRLVFCDSRRLVEELGAALTARGVTTFLSHSSLSVDERRRAEQAFGEARDCVIVATSTLELGIDVGDLDRVIQINAPATVASFLQRLGRTGRRPGSQRNCLFLCLDHDSLLTAAGLLLLWRRGFVEPVVPPPEPWHIVAQQLLAVALQEHRLGASDWAEQWNGLAPFDSGARPVLDHLLAEGFLDADGGTYFIGPEAEKRFGRRHFMTMTAVFTAPPQFTVLFGRQEIGQIDPVVLTMPSDGPRRLLLAGRSWRVTSIEWSRRRCQVEEIGRGGRATWLSGRGAGLSFVLERARRDVLLGAEPDGVLLSRRAIDALTQVRDDLASVVGEDTTVIERSESGVRWWTWAGLRVNATLAAALTSIVDADRPFDGRGVLLRDSATPVEISAALSSADVGHATPEVDHRALAGLKFSDALRTEIARSTLSRRLADPVNALTVLAARRPTTRE